MHAGNVGRRWMPLALALVGVLVIFGTALRPSQADAVTGESRGEAYTLRGQVLNLVGLDINTVNLPPGGTSGVQLNVGASVPTGILGTLNAGVTSGTVTTNCVGTTSGPAVEATCTSTVEGLNVGLELTGLGSLLGLNDLLSVISATTLQSVAHCVATDGSPTPVCDNVGSTIVNLNIGGTVINAATPTNVPVDVGLGIDVIGLASVDVGVTGNVGVFQVANRTTDGGDTGAGRNVQMLDINLALGAEVCTVLGGCTTLNLGVLNLDLVVADAFVGAVQEEPTATPTNTNTPVPTNTSTPTNTATVPPGSTATNTPQPTNTPPPGSTATNTPPPGSTATNTPPPGSTATNTATATATATRTNTPPPGSTNTPVPAATSTPTSGGGGGGGPVQVNTPTPAPPNTGLGQTTAQGGFNATPIGFGLGALLMGVALVWVARRGRETA